MTNDPGEFLSFPKGFIWGTATSSYQIEGGWLEGGKGLSVWDAFSHTPGKILNQATGDIACDHYHRFQEDVALLAEMGVNAYRFSISWPRIQPDGRGKPNPDGLRFYSDLIDALLARNITPWATLHHWDLPIALQMELDGWLNPETAGLFGEYARICFDQFGDRVVNWITLNEPWVTAVLGYGQGVFAPGRTSSDEPYLAAHHLLLAHALAVAAFRETHRGPKGRIGMANNCDWREPRTSSEVDCAAAQRAVEFFLGWFADPLYFGDYPEVMRQKVGKRLPEFTSQQRELVQGSVDYFGLNHYTTLLAAEACGEAAGFLTPSDNAGLSADQSVHLSSDPGWKKTDMGWAVVPWGCRKLLEWVDRRYQRPTIILTENGCSCPDRLSGDAVIDSDRIAFIQSYLAECHRAIENGIRLQGYFVWSFLDNFEWTLGYSQRFGLHYVDFPTGRRIPKESARWYRDLICRGGPPALLPPSEGR